jgi:hypothetical protein
MRQILKRAEARKRGLNLFTRRNLILIPASTYICKVSGSLDSVLQFFSTLYMFKLPDSFRLPLTQ